MKEFIINEFVSLRLLKDKTEIFVDGKSFHQCKFLMINIHTDEVEKYDKIDSIDEVADFLGWTYDGQEGVRYEIDPETEFWGHCSNLQAWYENDYDTRLLHSNLSFPLLKKLAEIGDAVAKRVLKQEIVERFVSGYPTTILCIFEENILDYLSGEEREQIIAQNFPAILTTIESLPEKGEFSFLSKLVDEIKEVGLLEENYISFVRFINKFPDEDRYDIFTFLLNKALDKGFSNEDFLIFLETIKEIPDNDKYEAFSNLINVGKEEYSEIISIKRWIEDNFLVFLGIIEKFPHTAKYNAFYDLICIIQDTNLVVKFYPQIESQFLVLIEDIHRIQSQDRIILYSRLLEIANITGLSKTHYPLLLRSIDRLKGEDKFIISSSMIIEMEGTELENEITFKEWKQKILKKNKIRKVFISLLIRFSQVLIVVYIILIVVIILNRSS